MVPAMIQIRSETPNDIPAISELHRAAFGPQDPVPELVNDLRKQTSVFPTISLVAQEAGAVLSGHVMVSHSWLDTKTRLVDVMVLSPLGVHPKFQGQGIGSTLIKRAIDATRTLNAPLLFLEGDPRYYGSRGFQPAEPLGLHRPSKRIPELAFQVVTLPEYAPDMKGTMVYRDVFWQHDCVGLRDNL